jgi:hypothetical protein
MRKTELTVCRQIFCIGIDTPETAIVRFLSFLTLVGIDTDGRLWHIKADGGLSL